MSFIAANNEPQNETNKTKKYLQTNVQRYGKANDLPFIALFEGIILVICRLVKKKKYAS